MGKQIKGEKEEKREREKGGERGGEGQRVDKERGQNQEERQK